MRWNIVPTYWWTITTVDWHSNELQCWTWNDIIPVWKTGQKRKQRMIAINNHVSQYLISFSNLVTWPADNLLARWPVSHRNRDECVRSVSQYLNSIITFAPHFYHFFLHYHPFPWISLRWVLQKGTRLVSPLLPWRIAYVMLSIDVDIDMKLTLGCKHQQFESKKSIWTYFTDMLGIELLTCYINWIQLDN